MRGLERYYFKKLRTPKWASAKSIARIYKYCKELNRKGVFYNYEVDHVIPLVHPLVCGLHCEDNLEVITAIENRSKSNNYWPQMWKPQIELQLECCMQHQLSLNF